MSATDRRSTCPIVLVGKRRGFSASMARYYAMIRMGLEDRGVDVRGVIPPDGLSRGLPAGKLRYWTEYFEQYVIFPPRLRRQLDIWDANKTGSGRCLVHVCDHSDAPIVRVLRDRPRTITVHDCIPRRVMEGEFPGQRKGRLGRLQQRVIYRALSEFPHLVAISKATKEDLMRFLPADPHRKTHVISNGPAVPFRRLNPTECEDQLAGIPEYRRWVAASRPPLLLIVGGNVFYKNREAAFALAKACGPVAGTEPWVMLIGPISTQIRKFPEGRLLHRESISDSELEAWYSLGTALLFPSLAEGFGWPLLEAQQTGCLIVTTDAPPMNAVAGPGALLLARLSANKSGMSDWITKSAVAVNACLCQPEAVRFSLRNAGYTHAAKFSLEAMLDGYEAVWSEVAAVKQSIRS